MKPGTKMAPTKGVRRLTTIDPFRLMSARLSNLFEDPFTLFAPFETIPEEGWSATWTPRCDIYETDKEVVIKAEIPGMTKGDVTVRVENNVLTIHGERKLEKETAQNFFRVERDYGEFSRSFALPVSVNPAGIDAQVKEGILTIILPKREQNKPKPIEVKIN